MAGMGSLQMVCTFQRLHPVAPGGVVLRGHLLHQSMQADIAPCAWKRVSAEDCKPEQAAAYLGMLVTMTQLPSTAALDLLDSGAVPVLVYMLTQPEGPQKDAAGAPENPIAAGQEAPPVADAWQPAQQAAAQLLANLISNSPECLAQVCHPTVCLAKLLTVVPCLRICCIVNVNVKSEAACSDGLWCAIASYTVSPRACNAVLHCTWYLRLVNPCRVAECQPAVICMCRPWKLV